MSQYLLLVLVILLVSSGQLLQKITTNQWRQQVICQWRQRLHNRYLWMAIICLVLGTLCWLLVLQQMPLSIAYPMLSLNFVVVGIASRFIFYEVLHYRDILGLIVIVIGVILLASQIS